MAGRGKTSFNKRLKEQKRAEKRQEKDARRQQRKLESQSGEKPDLDAIEAGETAPDSEAVTGEAAENREAE